MLEHLSPDCKQDIGAMAHVGSVRMIALFAKDPAANDEAPGGGRASGLAPRAMKCIA